MKNSAITPEEMEQYVDSLASKNTPEQNAIGVDYKAHITIGRMREQMRNLLNDSRGFWRRVYRDEVRGKKI